MTVCVLLWATRRFPLRLPDFRQHHCCGVQQTPDIKGRMSVNPLTVAPGASLTVTVTSGTAQFDVFIFAYRDRS